MSLLIVNDDGIIVYTGKIGTVASELITQKSGFEYRVFINDIVQPMDTLIKPGDIVRFQRREK